MARSFTAAATSLQGSMPAGLVGYTGALTISAWVNITLAVSTASHAAGFSDTAFSARGGSILAMRVNNTTTRWGAIGWGNTWVDSGETLTTNTWFHLLATKDATTNWVVYRGGVQKGTGTSTLTAVNGTTDKTFLFQGDTNAASWADLAVWKTQLTAGEITALANGARPGTIRQGSLMIWYPIDGLVSPEPSMDGTGFTGTLAGSTALVPGPPVAPFTPRWPQPSPPVYFTIRKQTKLNILQTGP